MDRAMQPLLLVPFILSFFASESVSFQDSSSAYGSRILKAADAGMSIS